MSKRIAGKRWFEALGRSHAKYARLSRITQSEQRDWPNGHASPTHVVFYFKHGAARENDQQQRNPEPRHSVGFWPWTPNAHGHAPAPKQQTSLQVHRTTSRRPFEVACQLR